MILGSKKRCFFLLCGIGSLLLLSSCGKVNYSHEALLDALNAFAEERSGDAGSRLSQILNRINALERALDEKLKDVNDRAKYIIELTDKWEGFSQGHLPALRKMAEDLENHQGGFNTLMEALNNAGRFRELSQEIENFNSAVDDTVKSAALKNLEDLTRALKGLDSSKVDELKNALKRFIEEVTSALTDDSSGETVVARISALSTSLNELKSLADKVSIAVKVAKQSQDDLQGQIDGVIARLGCVEDILVNLEKRTEFAGELGKELASLRGNADALKGMLAKLYEKSGLGDMSIINAGD